MITKKRFSSVDGVTSRFLSDFIIQSEQFARVYVYFYNPAGVEGEIDPGTGLPTRVSDFPNPAEDLVNLDKWDLVDNSILFYTEPVVGSSVYLEVATTPEEFGDTLTAPSVERAETAAAEAEASAAAALVSETNAAASEASINPTTLLHIVGTGAGNPEGYTTSEVDAELLLKADQATTYTKIEVDAELLLKADQATTYTKIETDTEISNRMSGLKNNLINPSFEINQYADIDTAPVAMVNDSYQIDRHRSVLSGITGTIQRLAKSLINGKYVHSVKCIAGSTASGTIGQHQRVELFYNGEAKTFGAWIKATNANARLLLDDGVTITSSTAHTGGGTYEFLSFPKTIAVGATRLYAYAVIASATLTAVTINTGEYIESTMWQLEDGDKATKFEQRPIGLELNLCQRYYETGNVLTTLSQYITGSKSVTINFSVQKRVAPTITTVDVGGPFTTTPSVDGFRIYSNTVLDSTARYITSYIANAEL